VIRVPGRTAYKTTLVVVAALGILAVMLLVTGLILTAKDPLGQLFLQWGGVLAPASFALLLICLVWRWRLDRHEYTAD